MLCLCECHGRRRRSSDVIRWLVNDLGRLILTSFRSLSTANQSQLNGKPLEQGNQFSLEPVEVITATINLEEIRSFRSSISRNVQAAQQPDYIRVEWDIQLSRSADEVFLSKSLQISTERELRILDPMSEIWMGTSVYLWQYLVRTSSPGFFLSLSGGKSPVPNELQPISQLTQGHGRSGQFHSSPLCLWYGQTRAQFHRNRFRNDLGGFETGYWHEVAGPENTRRDCSPIADYVLYVYRQFISRDGFPG